MEIGNAIVGVISIGICTVPFGVMYYKRVKNERHMMQQIKKLSQEKECTIQQHEFCGDFIIGTDLEKNFVFFHKQKKEETFTEWVDLSKVQSCEVLKTIRTIENAGESVDVTERIELVFWSKDKNGPNTTLELFDENVNLRLTGELQFADRYAKTVNNELEMALQA